MAKYRVIRGSPGDRNGRRFYVGQTFEAESAREAVKKSNYEAQKDMSMGGLLPSQKPFEIAYVYEMVPVDPEHWK